VYQVRLALAIFNVPATEDVITVTAVWQSVDDTSVVGIASYTACWTGMWCGLLFLYVL
jgi:hypothetical protein